MGENMNNIIFIVGEYHPYFSAVGTCCFNIAEEMAKDNKVIVICMKSYIGQPEAEDYKGQTIIRVSHRWLDIRLKLNNKIMKTNGNAHKWYTLLLNGVRAKEYLQVVFSKASIKKNLVRSYLSALGDIKEPITAVIPLCFPMDAVLAGMEYKKKVPEIKLIPYLFDPFVESHTLHRTEWNKKIKKQTHLKIEKKMLENSSKVFCVNQLKSHFYMFGNNEKSIVVTEHPLLKKKQTKECTKDVEIDAKVIVTYTGVFDSLIRNPEYFLRTMKQVFCGLKSELHLYTYGNCGKLIKKYTDESEGKIINHGYVTKEQADNAITQSHVLVSVGNIDNSQVPSKIIEYISACKPIIHFYTADDDVNINILKDYSLSLCLKQDDALFQQNADDFIKFCHKNINSTLDFGEVEKVYYSSTPKFIADQILSVINSVKNG